MEEMQPVLADEPIDDTLQSDLDAEGSAAPASSDELPVMTALAASNAATDGSQQSANGRCDDSAVAPPETTPPQQAQAQAPQPQQAFNGASPAATSGGGGNGLPTCQNCRTSTTPLWRRDEYGAVLCNACGLFLKLHGRPRPISLKTDVIKSRNRVKTMRTDLAPKKKATPQSNQASRRKSANGTLEDGESPISRTGTPSMYNQSLPFMVDDPYNGGVAGFGTSGDGSGSPMNGDRALDTPQTHEQLIAHNSSLKTRVSELEVINELFRGRLSQLEQQEAAARRGQEVSSVEQTQLRAQLEASEESKAELHAQLEDSHRRENSLKRRLDELELELKQAKDALEGGDGSERAAKRPRVQSPTLEVDEALETPNVVEEPKEETATEVVTTS